MFERLTEPARRAIFLAQDEARVLKHGYIGTEHLLLGLLRDEDGPAGRALESLGVGLDAVRAGVIRVIGEGNEVTTGEIPFTPRAKKVLELALDEARSLGHDHAGTEHLLLGIARENEGVASRLLLDLGADAQKIRSAVMQTLPHSHAELPPPGSEESRPPGGRGWLDRLRRARKD